MKVWAVYTWATFHNQTMKAGGMSEVFIEPPIVKEEIERAVRRGMGRLLGPYDLEVFEDLVEATRAYRILQEKCEDATHGSAL